MWKLKECPRCGGDFYVDRDYYDWYKACLQCGYVATMKADDSRMRTFATPQKWSREKRVRLIPRLSS